MEILVYFVITALIAAAFRPRVPEPAPPSLSDLNVPTAEEGRAIPVLFGRRVMQAPNIVWYGDLGYIKVKSRGGK